MILYICYGKFRNRKSYIEAKKKITDDPNIVNILESFYLVYAFFTFVLHFRRAAQVIHPYYNWFSAVSIVIIIASKDYFNSDMAFWVLIPVVSYSFLLYLSLVILEFPSSYFIETVFSYTSVRIPNRTSKIFLVL